MFVDVKAGETTDIGNLGDVRQAKMTKDSGRLDRERVGFTDLSVWYSG